MIGSIFGAMEVFGLLGLILHYGGQAPLNNWQFQLACWFIAVPIIFMVVLIILNNQEVIQ